VTVTLPNGKDAKAYYGLGAHTLLHTNSVMARDIGAQYLGGSSEADGG
jgi:hypothetical protein